MAFSKSNRLRSNSSKSKNLFVKIVHPGGHVELHDRPVLAAEIMLQNPKCFVAHPHVFQQPWATVAPETTLMLGQKFYVVPISTVRKLQRFSLKYSPVHHLNQLATTSSSSEEKYSGDRQTNENPVPDFARRASDKEDGFLCDIKYCFFWVVKAKRNDGVLREETRPVVNTRKRSPSCTRNGMRESPKRFASIDRYWQPSLESITEE